jgi:preprotein translocase subunit SecF
LVALLVFFAAIVLYISARFEWKMAIAALIAVIHDLLITVGIYSVFGFQVSPDTVVAILTILGYSLYDTVVVFDRVNDNSKHNFGASGQMTYSEMVNLSMNQTLARSMNTSLVAILPVLSVLLIGAQLLGATTLQDYGLALVIGLTSGAYSSIFIASPLLAGMKEREPRYINIRQKLQNRGDRAGLLTPAAAALLGASGGSTRAGGGGAKAGASTSKGVLKPGAGTGTGTQARAAATPPAAGGASPRPGGTRPPPRPRKGGGGKKGGKRRR